MLVMLTTLVLTVGGSAAFTVGITKLAHFLEEKYAK